jgi:hypothetical protein
MPVSLNDIKKILAGIAPGADFAVSEDTLGQPGVIENVLSECFGVDSLLLKNVSADSKSATLQGTAESITYLSQTLHNISIDLTFSTTTEDRLELVAKFAPGNAFNPLESVTTKFRLGAPLVNISSAQNYRHAFVAIRGMFCAGNIALPVAALYGAGLPEWQIITDTTCEPPENVTVPLADIFTLLDAKEFKDILPQGVVSALDQITVIEINFTCIPELTKTTSFSVTTRLGGDKKWSLMEGLELAELSLSLTVDYRGSNGNDENTPAFVFQGTFILNKEQVPVSVGFDSGSESLYVVIGQSGGIKLAGLGDFARITGPIGESNFPDNFTPGALVLDNLDFRIGYNKNETWCDGAVSIQKFSLDVRVENPLDFGPAFSVTGLTFSYNLSIDESGKSYSAFLLGKFMLAGIPFGLEIVNRSQSDWEVYGYTLSNAPNTLTTLLDKMVENGISSPRAAIPGIGLSFLKFHCLVRGQEYALSAGAYAQTSAEDFLAFESITAQFNLTATKQADRWKCVATVEGTARIFASTFAVKYVYSDTTSLVALKWKADDPGRFSISHMCDSIGFSDFSLPEGVDLSVTSVDISYDFKNKEFSFSAESEKGGRLYIHSLPGTDGKREFVGAVKLAEDIGLADLQLVGDSVPQLRDCRLKDIGAVVANYQTENLSIPEVVENFSAPAGLYIVSVLELLGRQTPVQLPLIRKTGNDAPLCVAVGSGAGKTFAIDKSVGPFTLQAIRLSFNEKTVWFELNAAFGLGALMLNMNGLSFGCTLPDKRFACKLDGLSLGVDTGAVTIQGGFLRQSSDMYSGTLLVATGGLSLAVVGSYRAKPEPSIFAFGSLRANLGGPPCFFVTGLAAAFGYGRNLVVPEIGQLDEFPLLKAATGKILTESVFADEDKYFPPKAGDSWLAAGILFTSFKMINSVAILTVLFGNDTEINLLGHSVLEVPFKTKKNDRTSVLARAVLLLKASLRPAEVLFSVDAMLASDSYILSKDCHLTGAFAFYAWYAGPHAGDFALTLGGYNSRYEKPAHYPSVNQLGLKWQISDSLAVEGCLYFALTPSCLMAGGYLKMQFTTRAVSAWFEARMDVLLQWKPFHYDFAIAVNIGVKVDLRLFSIKLEVGCGLNVWGPEFSGIATIHLWIISFTIGFGDSRLPSTPIAIDIDEFKESFLPPAERATDQLDAAPVFTACTLGILRGLVREADEKESEDKIWVANPYQLAIQVKTVIPVEKVVFNQDNCFTDSADRFFLRPCGGTALKNSVLEVHIEPIDSDSAPLRFECAAVKEKLPASLWAPKSHAGETIDACVGLVLTVRAAEYYRQCFKLSPSSRLLDAAWAPVPTLPSKKYDQQAVTEFLSQAEDQPVAERRDALLAGLGGAFRKPSLSALAGHPETVFFTKPLLASVGDNA